MTETVYRISETLFDPGTEYIASVYNKIIPNDYYHGTMSHGSAEIRWNTPQAGKSEVSVTAGDMNHYVMLLFDRNNPLISGLC